ncbi:mitochondrial carrier domain-containing protein [Boletus reticuloceps]|uniref:Mitochondrial carrier domain-containing protein n=1 Tax=Boletus reticuloceps TaxID=495285 RepID=A0A8I2YHQ1_9AGAM|nr:mitochondrial carrier domain-containing protein [Boletus reticuloceps]
MSAGTTTNPEAQPLLSSSEPPTYLDDNPVQNSRAAGGSDEESNHLVTNGPPKTRSWSTIAFQSVIVLLSLIVVGLFIKGFIDADDVEFDLGTALKKALGGGLSGAAGENLKNSFKSDLGRQLIFSYLAMVLQVLALMPLRTVMNYQYRYGTTSTQAIKTLYEDGGWTRYYQGLAAALVQGPVSRFGDTAANVGILALLQSNTFMRKLPTLVKTIFASMAAACFRMLLTPVDTIKTTMQTQGKDGMALLRARVKKYGVGTLWYGALATAAATFVGHYPWFGTYNYLDATLPLPTTLIEKLVRSAFIGFVASIASDCISNSLRVVKTYRQVNATRIAYLDAARAVIAADGVTGLFGRGLKTRILANGLQGIMFSVLWKLFMDL